MGLLIVILGGLATGIGGIGYRVAGLGKVSALQNACVLSFWGIVFFGCYACFMNEWSKVSWQLFALAVVAGVLQYVGLKLFDKALTLGPMSLVWCTISMSFVPSLVYSHVAFDEPVTVCQSIAIVMVLLVIVLTSFSKPQGEKQSSAVDGVRGGKSCWWKFGLILLLMIVSAGFLNCSLKFGWYYKLPGEEESLMQSGSRVYMTVLYLIMLLTGVLDLSIRRAWIFNRMGWIGGAVLSLGKVLGYGLQLITLSLPATLVFALPATTSMSFVAIISVLFFKEKVTSLWFITVLMSLGAIFLMIF